MLSAAASAPRIHFTEKGFDNPKAPPMFCMLMRKHLSGAKLAGIEQFGLERILHLSFSTYNELGDPVILKLAVEIMGRHSNIILIGDDGSIVDSIKRVTEEMSSVRQVLPGMRYVFPPAQDKLDPRTLDFTELERRLAEGATRPLSKALLEHLDGVSPIVCRELSFRAAGDLDPVCDELSAAQKERLREAIFSVGEALREGSVKPYMVCDPDGRPLDFTFLDVRQYEDGAETKSCASFSELLDRYYADRTGADRMKQRSGDLFRFIANLRDRLARKLEVQRQELAQSAERESLRVCGELIHTNLYALQKGMTSATVENYYDENRPLAIKLDPRLTPVQNAQRYYNEYRKADNAEKILKELIEKGENELAYVDSVYDLISRARTEDELLAIRGELLEQGYLKNHGNRNWKPPKLPPMEYVSSDGFRILCGRNNLQNDRLTLKDSRKTDLWFHAQKIPGSHTVVAAEDREIPERTILEAAVVAAYNSKARDSALVPVDYAEIRYVRKPGGAAPGKVIYDHYKTVYVKPSQFEELFGSKS